MGLEERVAITGIDQRVERRIEEETAHGTVIHGADSTRAYSGDYTRSFLARTTGAAMRKVFEHYERDVTPVATRGEGEAALDASALVWLKTMAGFLEWQPITWVTPDDMKLPRVLGNDHAAVGMGYNEEVVVIRDALGPTTAN